MPCICRILSSSATGLSGSHYVPVIPESVKGNYNAIKHVFKRSLDEISIEATETVLELIAQNSLYKGAEWKKPLTEFKRYQKEYSEMNEGREKDLYAWEKIY